MSTESGVGGCWALEMLFCVLSWEGHGQRSRQSGEPASYRQWSPPLRYWGLSPRETGDLVSGSPATPGPRLQHIVATFLDLENFSRPSLPPSSGFCCPSVSRSSLFCTPPSINGSCGPHLAFGFSSFSKMLPTHCILYLLQHPATLETGSRCSSSTKTKSSLLKSGLSSWRRRMIPNEQIRFLRVV